MIKNNDNSLYFIHHHFSFFKIGGERKGRKIEHVKGRDKKVVIVKRKAVQSHTKFIDVVMTRAILLDVLRKATIPLLTQNGNLLDFWLVQTC